MAQNAIQEARIEGDSYHSVQKVATRLGFDDNTIIRHIRAGDFPGSFYSGGAYRIPESGILAYLEAHRVDPARPVGQKRRKSGGAREVETSARHR